MTDNRDSGARIASLQMGFGSFGQPTAKGHTATRPYRLMVMGDFGGSKDNSVYSIEGGDLDSVMKAMAVVVEVRAPNLMDADTPVIRVDIPVARMRDFTPEAVTSKIPQLGLAQTFIAEMKKYGTLSRVPALERFADIDLLVGAAAALETSKSAPQANGSPAAPTASAAPSDLDNLLGMVDVAPGSGERRQPSVAEGAVSAFLAAMRENAPAPKPLTDLSSIEAIAIAQRQALVNDPTWRGVEAAWQGLRLVTRAGERSKALALSIADVDPENRIAFLDALADLPEQERAAHAPDCIILFGGLGVDEASLQLLLGVGAAAERLECPIMVSLAFGSFTTGALTDASDLDAIFSSSELAIWDDVRQQPGMDKVCLIYNDVLLRGPKPGLDPLWCDPGFVVAGLMAQSLKRGGWPSEILGAEAGLDGFETLETLGTAGRPLASPLRRTIGTGLAQRFATYGIAALCAMRDRDLAFLPHAPMVAPGGNLPLRLASMRLGTLLDDKLAFTRHGDDLAAASAFIEDAANHILSETGRGAQARVRDARADEDGGVVLELAVRFGSAVLGGASINMDVRV